jgi:3-oxocholest-4-en-26-oate---CoA ligase
MTARSARSASGGVLDGYNVVCSRCQFVSLRSVMGPWSTGIRLGGAQFDVSDPHTACLTSHGSVYRTHDPKMPNSLPMSNVSAVSVDFNLAEVHEAIAAAVPDRACIIWRGQTWTWRETTERSRRLANYLIAQGVANPVQREFLDGHEAGQDTLGIYLHNGNEYLEAMLGAYKSRTAPFNVNYRYVAEELRYLLNDASCKVLIYHSAFAPTLAEILPDLPNLTILLQVSDDSGNALLPGAVEYETALASASPERPEFQVMGGAWSPDDLYVLYTGGTTGMPKGVLWRQGDAAPAALGLSNGPTEWTSVAAIVENAVAATPLITLPSAPFMHGAGQWIAFRSWHTGGAVVVQSEVLRLDPAEILTTIVRENVSFFQIVGDAFGRPLIDEIDRAAEAGTPYDLSKLAIVLSGGAALSAGLKQRFLSAVPHLILVDGIGSSEAGGQMQNISAGSPDGASTGTFICAPNNHVLSDALDGELEPGHEGLGWLAKSGRLPLGYLGDAAKTAKTFPTVARVRYSVPGDRARLLPGSEATFGLPIVELHGRDSVTINSGGEKIFAEEVEAAIIAHTEVYDCVVAGRPSERWGNEVVAIVQRNEGSTVSDEDLLVEAAKHVARYKLPKAIVYVDKILRSPSGKADYRWAKEQAAL